MSKALKITMQTNSYKNEMRVDISSMEEAEIISLASEIVKSMLNNETQLPQDEDE
jgi:hypothetical protein